jgi:hypothetical protein
MQASQMKIQWTDAEKQRLRQVLDLVDRSSRLYWETIHQRNHSQLEGKMSDPFQFLILRDNELAELRAEIERLKETAANKEKLLQIACDQIERLRADVSKLRDLYASQAKFADHEPAAYFREFVERLNRALEGK